MQSIFYGLLSFLIALFILIIFAISSDKDFREKIDIMENNLDKTYILNSNTMYTDTLTIINFSLFNDSYTLSNGLEIHSSLIK